MIDCTDEMCDVFIARGVVSHLMHLTQIEEPEEVSAHVFLPECFLTQYMCSLYTCTAVWESSCVCSKCSQESLPTWYVYVVSLTTAGLV